MDGPAAGSCCPRRGWRRAWPRWSRAAATVHARPAPSPAGRSACPSRRSPIRRRRRRPSTAPPPRRARHRSTTAAGRRRPPPMPRRPPTPPEPLDEVVVDVQTHFLESGEFGLGFPQASCGEADPIDCFSAEYWRDLVLAQSDTRVAVISAVPVVGDADPLSVEAMERGRALAAELCGDGHVLIQGHAVPDVGPIEAAVAAMEDVAASHQLSAWKVYTHSPSGWFLDDHDPETPAIGQRFLDACRSTGVPTIAVHKGLSGGNPYASPGRHRAGRRGQPRPALPRVPLRLRDLLRRGSLRPRRSRGRPAAAQRDRGRASAPAATSTPSSARRGGG